MKQKTYSDIKPEKNFDIENVENGKCTVLFFDNIQEEKAEENKEKVTFSYDTFSMEVPYRENLAEEIEKNIDDWLESAKKKDYDEVAAEIRKQRDELLTSTDWTQMKDTALSEEKQKKYQEYRQKLRDIPEQPGFPYDVVFPSI